MNCICACVNFSKSEHACWEVTPEGVTQQSSTQKLSLGKCSKCGVLRQVDLPFSTAKQLEEFYKTKYPPTKKEYLAKTYEHDRALAVKRCLAYGIEQGCECTLLDVGSALLLMNAVLVARVLLVVK